MSKGKGIKPYGAIVRKNNGSVDRSSQNTSSRSKRLNGQKGLPSRTTTVTDVGDGWTYEV